MIYLEKKMYSKFLDTVVASENINIPFLMIYLEKKMYSKFFL